jgi:hypothetical protein
VNWKTYDSKRFFKTTCLQDGRAGAPMARFPKNNELFPSDRVHFHGSLESEIRGSPFSSSGPETESEGCLRLFLLMRVCSSIGKKGERPPGESPEIKTSRFRCIAEILVGLQEETSRLLSGCVRTEGVVLRSPIRLAGSSP